MDATKLAETLRLHKLSLEDEGGVQADLHGANLHGADLRGANLRWAIGLHQLDMVDPRCYRPLAVAHPTGWRIHSGCRSFTPAEALEHWGDPDYDGDPGIAARYVRAINALPECPTE